MTEITLAFDMIIRISNLDNVDDLGKELAAFLQESLFNGEDVLDISYKGYSLTKIE